MTADEIKREYDVRLPRLEQLRTEVLFSLENALRTSEIKLHSISSRIKTLDSFLEKVSRKGTDDPFNDIRDLVGVRVVCLFLTDIPTIGGLIRKTFDVAYEDNKIAGGAVSSFGYMSVHFDVAMKDTYVGPRYDQIATLPCEIQVRTIAMDAWANVAHHLSYKTDVDVPAELKKDFYALSGLFYVADKHFEMFYDASVLSRRAAVKAIDAGTPAAVNRQPLDADILAAFLAKRYPKRERASDADISELLSELVKAGVTTVGELDRILTTTRKAFAKYERDHPPADGDKFTEVGVARISAKIYDRAFHKITFARAMPRHTEAEFERSDQQYDPYRDLIRR